MTNEKLFSLACRLSKYYSCQEVKEIVLDYKTVPIHNGDSPAEIVEALLLEEGRRWFQIRRGMLAAVIASAIALIGVYFVSAAQAYYSVKYLLFAIVLSVSLWNLINGSTIARFSLLNCRINKGKVMIALLNVALIAIPLAVMIVSKKILMMGGEIGNPALTGKAIYKVLRVLEVATALISIFSLFLSVHSSILYYTVCINSIGVFGFCASFIYAMGRLDTPTNALLILSKSLMPVSFGAFAAVFFYCLIHHLIGKGVHSGYAV